MKITILNGDMNKVRSSFTEYIEKLAEEFKKNHSIDLFHPNKMTIHQCKGCWNCWVKTPGKCVINDDAENIFRSVINSDFIIFASPLMVGFTSSILKKITDRLIVLLHPYIKLKDGEQHHLKRYNRYPNFGLILEKEPDTDNDDLKIVKDIYDRISINFHCKMKYIKFIDQDQEDIVYETCNI